MDYTERRISNIGVYRLRTVFILTGTEKLDYNVL